MKPEEFYTVCEFQVNQKNGDIDFVEVFDLPEWIAFKFVKEKYPDAVSIEVFKSLTINEQSH